MRGEGQGVVRDRAWGGACGCGAAGRGVRWVSDRRWSGLVGMGARAGGRLSGSEAKRGTVHSDTAEAGHGAGQECGVRKQAQGSAAFRT